MDLRIKNATVLLTLLLTVSAIVNAESIQTQKQQLSHHAFGSVEVIVPQGYELEILNASMRRPRMITFASNGDIFIGSSNFVYRLKPPYRKSEIFLQHNDYPHSVAIRGNEMFIATVSGLYHAPYEPSLQQIRAEQLTLVAKLPGGMFGHSSRTVGIDPEGRVFVSLGITGNCSDEFVSDTYKFDDRRGGFMLLDESISPAKLVPYASGLRNPIGFDWHPSTDILYASNNGPDHLGYDFPPEYFSKVTEGSFHGMPWYQSDGERVMRDPCINKKPPYPFSQVQLPVATFPARNAPMGVAFVPTGAMDERFTNSAFVALRGSWATQPDGFSGGSPASRRVPAVTVVKFKDGEASHVEIVISGFQDRYGSRWARPVGVGIGPDGWLYITSDSGDFQGLMRLRQKQ